MDGTGLNEESKGTKSVGEGAGRKDGFEEVRGGCALRRRRGGVGFCIFRKEGSSTVSERGKLGSRWLLQVRF